MNHLKALVILFGLGALVHAPRAEASPEWIVKDPTRAPYYQLEIEPHLVFTNNGPGADAPGSGWGAGVRGSWVLDHDGFLEALNDVVALTAGAQIVRYSLDAVIHDRCNRFRLAPDGVTQVCVDVNGTGGDGDATYLVLPLALHWGFFLTPTVSAFGELGLIANLGGAGVGLRPAVAVGGRWHVSDQLWLVLRVGTPEITIGASLPF